MINIGHLLRDYKIYDFLNTWTVVVTEAISVGPVFLLHIQARSNKTNEREHGVMTDDDNRDAKQVSLTSFVNTGIVPGCWCTLDAAMLNSETAAATEVHDSVIAVEVV